MMKCVECNKDLKDDIFVGEQGNGIYCDEDCYIDWYKNSYDTGYYTTVKEYKRYMKELERRILGEVKE